jgi:hypothetical protein
VREVARCCRQQRPINHPELRSHDLPAQDLELVAQQDLQLRRSALPAVTTPRVKGG